MEILKNMVNGVGSAAMLLAMTGTMTDEQYLKSYLTSLGYKVAVTEVSGKYRSSAFQSQMIRSVLGAVLNQEVISKNSYDVHAVLHALVDAKKGLFGESGNSSDLEAKIAIARKDTWIAAAIYGRSAIYHLTNHERASLGIMHI
ncbi:MAG: HutP family protein [Succiniclasticum sp.]|jgi:hut operon positive regulator|nr:HutP family protein [Succiniclasticum sp.]